MERSTHMNVHYYKLQLQNVIENLEKLEQTQHNVSNLQPNEVTHLLTETSAILTNLEEQPIHKIQRILKKRTRKRQRAKLKRKQTKNCKDESSNVNESKDKAHKQILPKTYSAIATTQKLLQKPHQQLRSYRDADRFLKTFELLELLHAARSHDEMATREFANKLSKLRTIWNVIRFENKPDFTATQNVENQWNNVLFGTHEKSFYKQKRGIVDLINTRRKWDSFVTSDAKIGSTIPVGWVLPPENADERWRCHQIE